MTHSKSQLRSHFRKARRLRSQHARTEETVALMQSWENACLFFGIHPWSPELYAALFIPTEYEPPVMGIVSRTTHCILPLLFEEEQRLSSPAWGISACGADLVRPSSSFPPQPRQGGGEDLLGQAKIVLVPALAIDEDGVRLGQGGGWYDRALLQAREGTPVVGVVFDDEFLPGGALPLEPHDRLVDAVITPTRFIPLPVHG